MRSDGDTTKKCKRLSFVNDKVLCVSVIGIAAISAFLVGAVVLFWHELPLALLILFLMIAPIMLAALCFMPFNGMYIRKDGTVVFLPDFRIIICKPDKLKWLAVEFTPWENGQYSARIRLFYQNGKTVSKDYAEMFQSGRHKKSTMSMYTIERAKVDKIASELRKLDKCEVTMIERVFYSG